MERTMNQTNRDHTVGFIGLGMMGIHLGSCIDHQDNDMRLPRHIFGTLGYSCTLAGKFGIFLG